MKPFRAVVLLLFFARPPVFAQTSPIPQPREVTYCDLSRDPAAFNHAFVRLTAFVTHGFEDFAIHDPQCPTQGFSVWLMYGGKTQSNTMYCCPGEASQETRKAPITVEGITVPLDGGESFQQFRDLLNHEPDTTVRTTMVGRFFSGKREILNMKAYWRGFGHMGCCSLFVIQNVDSFEPHSRSDLDYTAEAGWYEPEDCKWETERELRHVSIDNWDDGADKGIVAQQSADAGQSWAFTDPLRVATESLKPLYPGQVPILHRVKDSPARQVFRWRDGKRVTLVVVARPYWLSFYATGSSVAWVATMVKEVGCK